MSRKLFTSFIVSTLIYKKELSSSLGKFYTFLNWNKYQAAVVIALIALHFLAGCAQQKQDESLSPTEAQEKFVKLCKAEYNLDVITKRFDNTLWVYLTLDHAFLSLASSKKGPSKSADAQDKLFIRYLDGEFDQNSITIKYDIDQSASYKDDRGITTKMTEEYSTIQQFLLGAINRAYGDTETSKEVPDFFVIIIADIFNGIKTRMTFYLEDLRRAHYDPGFGEEYIKRLVVDQPIGHDIIIGDKSGEHIEAYDMTWLEFLMKQMIYRTTLKYTYSSFPPSEDTRKEILTIAADTVAAYDFSSFTSLKLQDLNTQTSLQFSPQDLASYATETSSSEGRLIHINFQQ